MEFVDSHCHLETFIEQGQLENVLQFAEMARVTRMITVGTSPQDWPIYRNLATHYSRRIYWTAGLHPNYVDKDWQNALIELRKQWQQTVQPIAIGEMGLDYFRLPKETDARSVILQRQRDAFAAQLEFANQLDCPVIIHSRAAFKDCLEVIDASGFPWERIVFHCFSYDDLAMKKLNQRGGIASFTGMITFKKSEASIAAMQAQGLDHLMLETDSPYLAPSPYRGKQNQPSYIVKIAEFCSNCLQVSLDEIASQTTQNSCAFYAL